MALLTTELTAHFRVANAGIAQVKALLDMTEEDFSRMFAVNVQGLHNSYAEAALQMISQGTCKADAPGKILGASSIVGFKPFPLLAHYSASKWAVRGLTQAYAMEMAEHHITVNAWAPGIVGTSMWEPIDAEFARRSGRKDLKKGDMMNKFVKDLTALGRVSVPEDVAKAVSFLCSSDSDFITGQTQVVDGGIVFT
jgi:NAD(P)-dependent dehydrogenase (short-subunit alcohol dehydrogenase family)